MDVVDILRLALDMFLVALAIVGIWKLVNLAIAAVRGLIKRGRGKDA